MVAQNFFWHARDLCDLGAQRQPRDLETPRSTVAASEGPRHILGFCDNPGDRVASPGSCSLSSLWLQKEEYADSQ